MENKGVLSHQAKRGQPQKENKLVFVPKPEIYISLRS